MTHCLRLNLQLHTISLVRTCRISSFCTVAWQLARFQLTRVHDASRGHSAIAELLVCNCRRRLANSAIHYARLREADTKRHRIPISRRFNDCSQHINWTDLNNSTQLHDVFTGDCDARQCRVLIGCTTSASCLQWSVALRRSLSVMPMTVVQNGSFNLSDHYKLNFKDPTWQTAVILKAVK